MWVSSPLSTAVAGKATVFAGAEHWGNSEDVVTV